ncbi:hypothetical protein MNO11_18850 [Serratia plymuthica]|uniref:hypothetical protein n=1 Tax=Serratia plymuthica TaxID=82996 RepID=UPI001F53A153|nr:hypothetical protein [Serratia plymuthica]UNK26876.1 hypothetical protein MNO11_18850 [Serratia plymuthica]
MAFKAGLPNLPGRENFHAGNMVVAGKAMQTLMAAHSGKMVGKMMVMADFEGT